MKDHRPPAPEGWPTRFLVAMSKLGNVSAAARRARVSRKTVYAKLQTDPEFAEEFDQAKIAATEALEEEARRRAVTGWLKPVYQNGLLVGKVRVYSDTLLQLLLKANNPEKFARELRDVRHSGHGGGPIDLTVVHRRDLSRLSEEELRSLERILGGDTGVGGDSSGAGPEATG